MACLWTRARALVLAACFAAAVNVPAAASACGGFFCSNSAPVFQSAERIVFVHHDDGTMTAIIEVLYDGPAENFAWVIPAPGVPEVGVSSATVLDQLQRVTDPSFQLQTELRGNCWGGGLGSFGCGSASADLASGPMGLPDEGGMRGADAGVPAAEVNVLDAGIVGPYEWVALGVDPMSPDPADAAVDWLEGAGYDVSGFGRDRLRPYLEEGQSLLAFRLQKDADVGSIRPVMLRYPAPCPAIPLRPTAVAAMDDMGILVWVMGPSRAVPLNYLSVELNQARMQWREWSSPLLDGTYDEVVSAAVDEAGGRAFVTELATPMDALAEAQGSPSGLSLFPGNEREMVSSLSGRTLVWNDILQLMVALGNWDGMRDVVEAEVNFPGGLGWDDVVACPFGCLNGVDPFSAADVDGAAFLDAIDQQVFAPVMEAQLLFGTTDYLTRMYTTMDAEEMTSDPMFDFNPDLDDVSNVHTANRVIDCDQLTDDGFFLATTTYGQGLESQGEGYEEMLEARDELPAAYSVTIHQLSGEGLVLMENELAIQAALDEARPATQPAPSDGSERCDTTATRASIPWTPLVFAGLAAAFALRLRRRRS